MAFDVPQADRDEALALCDENLMDRMLDAGQLTDADLIPAVARRHVFPCWFGSALRRTETMHWKAWTLCWTGLTAIPVRLPRWMPLAPRCLRCRRMSRARA